MPKKTGFYEVRIFRWRKEQRMKDLLEAYENNKNFHDYVDKSMEQYGKSLEETLENKTVQEYLKSVEKGGINCKESEV